MSKTITVKTATETITCSVDPRDVEWGEKCPKGIKANDWRAIKRAKFALEEGEGKIVRATTRRRDEDEDEAPRSRKASGKGRRTRTPERKEAAKKRTSVTFRNAIRKVWRDRIVDADLEKMLVTYVLGRDALTFTTLAIDLYPDEDTFAEALEEIGIEVDPEDVEVYEDYLTIEVACPRDEEYIDLAGTCRNAPDIRAAGRRARSAARAMEEAKGKTGRKAGRKTARR